MTKSVTDLLANEPAPNPSGKFQVTVGCSNGFNQTMALNRGDSQTVSGLPVGTTCTVTEATPYPPIFAAPLSCVAKPTQGTGGLMGGSGANFNLAIWNAPSYSPNQTVIITVGANAINITNSFRCGGST